MPEIICPYCKSGVRGGSDAIKCLRCGTRHHWVCWMENSNHCSVFSCQGSLIRIRVRRKTDAWILLWCVFNYVVHLGLRYVGVLGNSLHFTDVATILVLEILIILMGILALRNRMASQSARSFGTLLFSSNAVFLLFLFGQLIHQGVPGVNSWIRL